jgi:hypothetical protein
LIQVEKRKFERNDKISERIRVAEAAATSYCVT